MPPDAQTGQPDYAVAAVERVFDVVAALVAIGPATLSEIAARAGCTRVTAFRALHTLGARGLAMQDRPRGRWRLGPAWQPLARAADAQRALALAAAPHLRALATLSQETVHLAIRDGQESQLLATLRSGPEPRPAAPTEHRFPLHAGPGRLLLANAPTAVQRSVLASRLPRLTESTRTDSAWIAADLPRIRARGWLIATDEVQDGIVTISRGVDDGQGYIGIVLTIQAPTARMRIPRPQTLLTPLIETATALERLLATFAAPR